MAVLSYIFNSKIFMKKGLLRFCVVVGVVLGTVAVVDTILGRVLDCMLPQISNQGDTGKTYYSLYDVDTPIVIVGSSRAVHHYVAKMMEDSLGLPAYNVARDGCFFSYNCCVINSIMDRYTPELIIWENGIDYLYDGVEDPLESLYPYYGRNEWVTRTIKAELPWTECIRLNSRIYQYNSLIHRILMRYCKRSSFTNDDIEKGYLPLKPKTLKKALELKRVESKDAKLSEIKVECFHSILERAQKRGVKMVVVESPMYRLCDVNGESAIRMKSICDEFGALFLDNSQLPEYLDHPEYFNDATHMNADGAERYTRLVLNQIEKYLN